MTFHTPRRVEKPWGWELRWAETELYLGKILHIHAGEALSLQYHEKKDETFCVLSGELTLLVGRDAESLDEVTLRPNDAWRVRPGVLHRMVALTECEILEASTPHPDDIVRLDDRYGRSSDDAY